MLDTKKRVSRTAELDARAMKIEQAKTMSTASMLFATVAARDFASCFISNHRFRLPDNQFTFKYFLRFLLKSNLASDCDCDIILNKVIYRNKPGNSQVIFGRCCVFQSPSSCNFAYSSIHGLLNSSTWTGNRISAHTNSWPKRMLAMSFCNSLRRVIALAYSRKVYLYIFCVIITMPAVVMAILEKANLVMKINILSTLSFCAAL